MIPKKIHYVWIGGKELPEMAQKCLESWQKQMPDFEICRWDETNSPMGTPYIQYMYTAKKWAFVSDYIRFWVLTNEGGLYFDTDSLVLKPFGEELLDAPEFDAFLGWMQDGHIGCGVIGATPHHPFIEAVLKEYDKADPTLFETCPQIVTRVYKSQAQWDKLKIFDIAYFNPCEQQEKRTPEKLKLAYVDNLYAESWVSYRWLRRVARKIGILQTVKKINNNFLHLDLHFLIKNSFYTISSYIVSIACTLLITYIIANTVSEHHTGIYRYVFSWYGVLGAFMLSGVTSALTISTAKGYNSLRKAFIYKGWFSFFGLLACLAGAFYYKISGNQELFWNFVLMAISLPILEISNLYGSFLQGSENFKTAAKLTIINKVSTLASIIFFIYILHLSNSYILLISNITVVAFIQLLYIYKIHALHKLPDPHETPDPALLKSSIHFSLMGAAYTIGQQADKFILFKFFGSTALAGYWIATVIPLELQRFLAQITSIYVPKIIRLDETSTDFRKKFIRILWVAVLGLVAMVGIYHVCAPYIFNILFPKYTDIIPLSKLFFWIVVFTPFTFIWSFFLARLHIKKTYFFHIADPAIQIALYVLFIPVLHLGVTGVVYAILAKNAIMSMIGLAWFIKR